MSEGTRNTPDGPQVRTMATRYDVTCIPEDNINVGDFTITVEYRGENRWAVMHGRFALGADDAWDYEPSPGSREDDWMDTHRFDLDTALRLAQQEAPNVTVNSWTVAEVLEQHAEGRGRRRA